MRPALLAAGLLVAAPVFAQLGQAITDSDLYEPWVLTRNVAANLPAADGPNAARDAQALDDALARLRAHFEEIAVSIVARPEFPYDAAQASAEMAGEVGLALRAFDAWLGNFPADNRVDAEAARRAIGRQQEILAQRNAFERDVMNAVGSGSKHAIQALSRRWWTASERVEEFRAAVAAGRK